MRDVAMLARVSVGTVSNVLNSPDRVSDATRQRVEEAIAKHHRDLPLEVTTASMAEATLPAWFTGKLDFKPTPPKLEDGGARMIGARMWRQSAALGTVLVRCPDGLSRALR